MLGASSSAWLNQWEGSNSAHFSRDGIDWVRNWSQSTVVVQNTIKRLDPYTFVETYLSYHVIP